MEKDYWKNKNILVTGGTGFIGSWLIKKLSDLGANVICLAHETPKQNSNYTLLNLQNKTKFILVNLSDKESKKKILEILNKSKISHIFHLAGQAILKKAFENPLKTYETNTMGTIRLLEACRSFGWEKLCGVVICSSINAYGKGNKAPYTEEQPLNGEFPYEVSFSCLDKIAQSYGKVYKLPVSISRLSNVYGPGDLNFKRLIPSCAEKIIKNEEIILRGGGKIKRNFLYVEDAINGLLILSMETDKNGFHGDVFNFGSQNPATIKEMIETMIEESGINFADLITEPKLSTAERGDQYSDISKAKRMLNWTSQIGLEEGLRKTFKWHIYYFSCK